jgi:hypothetical protein
MSRPNPTRAFTVGGEHSSKELFEQRINSYLEPPHMSPRQSHLNWSKHQPSKQESSEIVVSCWLTLCGHSHLPRTGAELLAQGARSDSQTPASQTEQQKSIS